MGLALDEPKEGDQRYQVNEVPLIVDPFALKLITQSGGLTIKSSIFGPTAELENVGQSGCSC